MNIKSIIFLFKKKATWQNASISTCACCPMQEIQQISPLTSASATGINSIFKYAAVLLYYCVSQLYIVNDVCNSSKLSTDTQTAKLNDSLVSVIFSSNDIQHYCHNSKWRTNGIISLNCQLRCVNIVNSHSLYLIMTERNWSQNGDWKPAVASRLVRNMRTFQYILYTGYTIAISKHVTLSSFFTKLKKIQKEFSTQKLFKCVHRLRISWIQVMIIRMIFNNFKGGKICNL
jgi:hypothetical protein